METTQKKAASFKGIRSAGWVIVICFIIAVLIFHFVLGNPSNFMNNDPNNHPLPGNFLGTIYKGGFIVPVIQTLLLTVIALSIERYIAIGAAFGKGSLVKFVANIKAALAEGDMKKAQQICDSQRGSVANVVNATLKKYAEMENDTELSKDQKLLAIQKELEEATALELPMMENAQIDTLPYKPPILFKPENSIYFPGLKRPLPEHSLWPGSLYKTPCVP